MIYRLFYQIGLLLLKLVYRAHPKLQKGYELRQKVLVDSHKIYPWLNFPKHTKPVWFHCASGEFEYALPLIRKIKEKNPEQKILVTYFTPSYLPRLTKETLVDYLCPAPWDKPLVMRDFIEHHEPRALLIARTDVWSEMTEQCYRHRIPTVLFSMTFNKRINPLSYFFYLWQFRFITQFFVVSDADKKKLSRIYSGERIFVTGDTRYEQCLYRLAQGEKSSVNIKIDPKTLSKKVFVAGSLWPEDEAPFIQLIKNQPALAHWILVPHEIHSTTLERLKEQISNIGQTAVFSSQISSWNGEGVLIVDEFGLLAHLYKISDFAFVGGSFKKNVHSVMEPLATGALTFVGPYYHNSREAEEFSTMTQGFSRAPVQIVTRDNFETSFSRSLSQWTSGDKDRLKKIFLSRAHATEQILQKLDL